ncbi:hypothetical protein ACMDCR_32460 [Labrys okinawensis]|uniref:hypothetical protein n=1 Tax=Labrys okinawensis TaxID=346911 RepID=UPI0039BCA018
MVLRNTVILVAIPLFLTISLGVFIAVVFNDAFPGRWLTRLPVVGPFFVMTVVSALGLAFTAISPRIAKFFETNALTWMTAPA